MLEIVTGRTGSGKTALCLERIEEKLLGDPAGQKIILLLLYFMLSSKQLIHFLFYFYFYLSNSFSRIPQRSCYVS